MPLILTAFAALTCLSLHPVTDTGSTPQRPPALSAGKWINWIGDGPTLESLEGRTVLVHFFVCKKPKNSVWLGLLKIHHDHAAKGLVILAVTRDSARAVEKLLEDHPLPFPIGAASNMAKTWGVSGDYGQVLLDRHGEIFYRTDAANGIWNGKLLKGLKGSDRVGEAGILRLVPTESYGRRLKKALGQLADGKLAKALASLTSILEASASKPDDLEEAASLKKAVEVHVATLMEQIEAALERREVLPARSVLKVLAKEFKRHPLGEAARKRLAELEQDEDFAREVEAAEEYEHLVEAFFRRGWSKNLTRFEKMTEDFPDTRAAQKMRNYWIQCRW